MEKYGVEISLLNKFSNCKWVLSYYNYFCQCQILMSELCRSTKEGWDDNYNAFSNSLEHTRQVLVYTSPFDEKIASYLLENNRYRYYSLDLNILDEKSITSLINFIFEVKIPSMLKFKGIISRSEKTDIDAYNSLCVLFRENHFLDINKIKFTADNFKAHHHENTQQINYIHLVRDYYFKISVNKFNHGKIYRIVFNHSLIIAVRTITTNVRSFMFGLKTVPRSAEGTVLSPQETFQNSLQSIIIDKIREKKLWKLEYLLPKMKEKFPNLKNVSFHSGNCSTNLFVSVIQKMQEGTASKLTLKELCFADCGKNEGSLIKSDSRIYLFNKDK